MLGHECIPSLAEQCDWSEIASSGSGLYFVHAPQVSVPRALRELWVAGLKTQDVVFQMSGWGIGSVNLMREYGAALALDNVGASSFQRIADVRPDFIKLDPRLTGNAEQPVCACTIRKLVELADKFDIKAVATGVDRLRTMENLWLLGLEIMQGDLFGRAAPEFAHVLEPVLVA